MTWDELKVFFNGLVDDSLDDDLAVDLANLAKDEVEGERDYVVLINVDETQSSSSGDTYNTNAKTIPTGFLKSKKLHIGDDRIPYLEIPFHSRERYKNSARRFYLDLANDKYYIAAKNISGTHHHFFVKRSVDITTSSTTLWAFPTRYDKLIGFKMAELFFAVDRGEKSRSWDDRWALQHSILKRGLVRWDFGLQKEAAKNDSYGLNIESIDDAIDTNK